MMLITTWYGVFLVDDEETGSLADATTFPEDPDAIAKRLAALEEGEILDEERAMVADLDAFRVVEDRLLHLEGATRVELDVMPAVVEKRAPDHELLRKASMAEVERKTGEVPADAVLGQAVQAMDELQRMVNLFDERLREWRPLSDDAALDADAEAIGTVEEARETVDSTRAGLEDHVDGLVREVAPNLAEVATPGVAARLISLAGGLEELARMPSGTIQTLGAENALFAHLTENQPPPKHGVIFQNPLVHRAPYKARGKISRALAGKIAIAARADAYTGGEIGADLREELEARVEEIRSDGDPA